MIVYIYVYIRSKTVRTRLKMHGVQRQSHCEKGLCCDDKRK